VNQIKYQVEIPVRALTEPDVRGPNYFTGGCREYEKRIEAGTFDLSFTDTLG
jgi:hypothetical protein